jgi:hypothetical protein
VSRKPRNAPNNDVQRLISLAGWWALAIGIVGLILHRSSYLPVWVALIAFGLAGAPRPLIERVRRRRAK